MDTERIIETIFLVSVLLVTMVTNIITLFVMAWTDYLRNINRVFLYSVTISDLCIGLFIIPFAVYCSIINKFGYEGVDPKLCHMQSYMTVVFFLSGVYALVWMNVDHYVAVRKPERYKLMMSPPRSLCWISFAWIAAVSFCCPPLLNFRGDTHYYTPVYICTFYIGSESAYFVTAGALALLPAMAAITITNIYLFTHGFRKKQKMYEAVVLEVSSRPRNYQINFIVSIIYIGTWLPWCVLRICSFYLHDESIPREFHFYTFWLAMGNSFYKFFVYASMSIEYRRGLRELFRQCCCKCCCMCNCCEVLMPRPNLTVNLVTTRLVAKPSTSGPSPASV